MPAWLAAPYAGMLVAFLAAPLANLMLLSLYRHSPDRIWDPVLTLDNYRALGSVYFLNVGLRTLRIGLVTTALAALLGYPVAYYLARGSRRMLAIGLFILFMPLMVSAVVGAFGWVVILGRNGILNTVLEALGIPLRTSLLYSEAAVVIALLNLLLPLMVLPLMVSIEKLPVRLEEAASSLGASPFLVFRRVVVPLSAPGLLSGALLCFAIAISAVVTPALLGGTRARMIGTEIYEQVVTAFNWPFASSLAVVLVALILLAMGLSLGLSRRRRQ